MTSSKVAQLHLLQQNIENLQQQKQQLESQLTELDSALTEVKENSHTYKILGKIMVATSPQKLSQELKEKQEIAKIRLQNLEKQNEVLKKNINKIQNEIMAEMKKPTKENE